MIYDMQCSTALKSYKYSPHDITVKTNNAVKLNETLQSSMANRRSLCLRQRSVLGLAVTLTFDLLTSKCNQFIFVPNCTHSVNLVKFTLTNCKYTITTHIMTSELIVPRTVH